MNQTPTYSLRHFWVTYVDLKPLFLLRRDSKKSKKAEEKVVLHRREDYFGGY